MTIDIKRLDDSLFYEFHAKLKKLNQFHFSFLAAIAVEVIVLFFLLPFLARSGFVAITLALFLVTLFGYISLKTYYESLFVGELKQMIDRYGMSLASDLSNATPLDKRKSFIAEAFQNLAEKIPSINSSTIPYLPGFALKWIKDWIQFGEHTLKEELLKRAIQNRVEAIRLNPTQAEKHAKLSSTYLTLSSHFDKISRPKESSQALERAVESLKILQDMAPQETQVLQELSQAYKKLGLKTEEMAVLETWLKLEPHQTEPMLRLGQLYFTEGKHALGFRTYEQLKTLDLSKSDELLKSFVI